MMSVSSRLQRAVLRHLGRTGKTQTQLGLDAGVDQSTISRVCRGQRQRSTDTYRALCAYMQQQPDWSEPVEAIMALDNAWDGTTAHDAALARLILASTDLWPELGKGSDGDG